MRAPRSRAERRLQTNLCSEHNNRFHVLSSKDHTPTRCTVCLIKALRRANACARVCVCTRESACVSRVLACLHVHMCLYMFCLMSPSCTHASFSMRGLIFNRNERLWMLIGLNTGKKKHFMCRRLHKGNVQPAQSRMEDIVLNHI